MSTTISGTSGVTFPDSTSMQTGQQAVKAWVNFNGTGTVAIRAGYNVSTITDNGTGNYTVNFTNALEDANYVCNVNASTEVDVGNLNPPAGVDRTASSVRIDVEASGGAQADSALTNVAIFR